MNVIKKYWLGLFIAFLFGFGIFLIYKKLNPKTLPENLVMGVGRIDGDLNVLNVKYPGRIKKLNASEGDWVKKGNIVAILQSDEYEAELDGISAEIKAKKQQLKSQKIQLQVLKETLPEDVKKAQNQVKTLKSALIEIQANIDTLVEVVKQSEKDFMRIHSLYKKNLVSKKKLEDIKLKLETDKNNLKALKEKKNQLISALKTAELTLKQAKSSLKKIEAIEQEIRALKNGIIALEYKKKQVQVILNQMILKSPIDGFVVDKIANVGEVIGAGMPVITIIDPKELYLKMFVDTVENGKIKIGDLGVIFLDAFPDRPIKAKVVKIAKKAEFTPKEVAVREDRIQRVYAVHLKPIKPNFLLKLGIPAVGIISKDGSNLPKSLKDLPSL